MGRDSGPGSGSRGERSRERGIAAFLQQGASPGALPEKAPGLTLFIQERRCAGVANKSPF
jgi:hypothetical protein